MNPLKSEVKIFATRELGADVEDKYEAAQKTCSEFVGAEEALKHCAKTLTSLHTHIDKDIEEGKVDDYLDGPLKVAEYAKLYVTRCIGLVENLVTRAEFSKFRSQGRADGLKAAVDILKKAHDQEEAKLRGYLAAVEAAQAAEESGEEVEAPGRPAAPKREPSGKPVDGLKSRRRKTKKVEE